MQQIFMEAMAHLDVHKAMLSKVQFSMGTLTAGDASLEIMKPPRVIAFGKAANSMTAAMVEILAGSVEAGVVISPVGPSRRLDPFQHFVGGHPYPTAGSLAGADAALRLVEGLTNEDLVIFLVSGGGSAMLEKPLDPSVTLADLVEFYRMLVTGGLPIEQMNVLRKHISAVKGGRLGLAASPSRQLTIYISDVPAGFASMVASGPTTPDESTNSQCYEIAERSGLVEKLPSHIRARFEERNLEETPKPGDKRFRQSTMFCLLSNTDAVEAAKETAGRFKFASEVDSGCWDGDYREVADQNLESLDRLAQAHSGRPVCLVVGGEVTCPVTGRGLGGRNQAFVLYAAGKVAGQSRVILSAGTDGRDGNSPSSGAVADGNTVRRAAALGLDPAAYLAESDSYHFFRTLGDTVETGFTDNNVRDLRLWLDFNA
ncbi:MAG: glycerate kinase type-2 family protein [Terriglobia bacterium]